MADESAPHLVIPKPKTLTDGEWELFRQVREWQHALAGTKVVVITVELTPNEIFVLEKKIINRVALGTG